ncbi:hypothetical protein BDV36DRAFT_295212 [Aspergillus pseudocaelatus]|uniref:Uncharacterized protein n=1 Tax=Aspergillus pseudocaelatus TaxID=1825620 RepID=A0ABQ6WMU0_9EURO|nr:hypothetical protein BDV36DRAFT_295212 [Aspergillus pseudocaelatus]
MKANIFCIPTSQASFGFLYTFRITEDFAYLKANQQTITSQPSCTEMPWYAVLDAEDESRHNDTCKDVIELQADRREAVRHAFECARNLEYKFIFKDRHGLGGLGGSGNPNEFLVELVKKNRSREPTVPDTADFVIGIVEDQFYTEDVCLKRWEKMEKVGIVTWLEELGEQGSKQQGAWSRLARELDENEWWGLFNGLKRLVELLAAN